ncbi:uncharacterized protein LOC133925781 [Phragmites australis]|uniref:uncharacterized protein LOC133925781 n=1 Tax=Phragmites australis TaxID=29695 RepID=UPI002D780705|nr:uncharacterized protein LOC133925781 [Phragmites australis]
MDWYAWLCKAGLHPDVAFEYALLFARNELGAADVRHLDHEFLASMGVAVAKHRIEILKLARRESSSAYPGKAVAAAITVLPWRATRLLAAAVHRSARSVLGRLRASVARGRGRDRAAAAVLAAPSLPLRHRGGRLAHWNKISSPVAWRGAKLPVPLLTHASKPMLTNSGGKWRSSTTTTDRSRKTGPTATIAGCLVSTEVCSCDEEEQEDDEEELDGGEEMRWESMFQDLKPTSTIPARVVLHL